MSCSYMIFIVFLLATELHTLVTIIVQCSSNMKINDVFFFNNLFFFKQEQR